MSETTLPIPAGETSVLADGPSSPDTVVVLAHGAGAGMRSDYMERFAVGLGDAGFGVVRFNFPYAQVGKRAPDRAPVLEQTFAAVVDHVREKLGPQYLVAGGKSMGGRIATQIAGGNDAIDGLVLLGYPLHPPGRPDRLRAEHLYDLTIPMLFVEGTRDPFCPLPALQPVLDRLETAELCVIDDGDHSLKVRKSSGRTTEEAWSEAIGAITSWLRKSFRFRRQRYPVGADRREPGPGGRARDRPEIV